MKVLDAGCGAGRHLCEAFRHPGIDVVGIDLSYDDLAKTRALLNLMSLELENQWLLARATITHLPFPDNVFDVVICSEVLEHIPDNLRAIKEIVRVLKPKGILAVSVPRFFPERVCWALSTAITTNREVISAFTGSGSSRNYWNKPVRAVKISVIVTPYMPLTGGYAVPLGIRTKIIP